MGYFRGLVICVINAGDGVARVQTEVIEFSQDAYVSWQRTGGKGRGWNSGGLRSISFKSRGPIRARTRYRLDDAVRIVTTGAVRKRRQYNFIANYHTRSRSSVFQVVLPPSCLPDSRTFQEDNKPLHMKRVGDRIALTWVFGPDIAVDFNYEQASAARFRKFHASGEPIRTLLPPGRERAIVRVLKLIDEKAEGFSAKVIAELLRLKQGEL